jgi:hypothetical protein
VTATIKLAATTTTNDLRKRGVGAASAASRQSFSNRGAF